MNKIYEMIATAPSKMAAINMLNTMLVFGDITEKQYKKGRELIKKEFDVNVASHQNRSYL